MIRGTRPQQSGFTVIEVIVFMSVSMALVASALALFNTRIPRTQFAQAVNELESQIRVNIDNVVNGYYPSRNDITCSNTGVISNATNQDQGTNANCLFLGQAIQFGPVEAGCVVANQQACDDTKTYTVYGQRLVGAGTAAGSIVDTLPRLIGTGTNAGPATKATSFGLFVTSVRLPNANPFLRTELSGFAFVQNFGGAVGANSSLSLAPIGGSGGVGLGESVFATDTESSLGNTASFNPQSGILVCLRSGTSNQFAVIRVGEQSRPLSTAVEVLEQTEWEDPAVCG